MLPGILTQLGSTNLTSWGRLASELAAKTKLAAAEEDDVPDLVENFEEVAKKDEIIEKKDDIDTIIEKTEQVVVS